jgi:putative spermidine/putrescine transport system ATP-binding protein/spermidine/putrescine transport system ATP-binding protein
VRFRRHVGPLLEYEIESDGVEALRAVALKEEAGAALQPGDRVALRLRRPCACTVFARP